MVDFVEDYYYDTGITGCEEEDRNRAKRKAFESVIPLIMQNELTQKQSICLRYKYINGKSQEEIAKTLKLSQPTVSRHINAAKDVMNTSLKYCYIALSKGIDEYENAQ